MSTLSFDRSYTPYQFSFFRIVFGLYLAIHFAMLVPYGAEVFSREGMLPDPALNATFGLFPNVLYRMDSPAAVTAFLSLLTLASLAFAAGYRRRLCAAVLWYGWACLFNRNNLISNPGIPYVGWLLLACAFIPSGEPLRWRGEERDESEWKLPFSYFAGAWILLAVGYTVSGIAKLKSPSWVDGLALSHLLENPLARDTSLREILASLPPGVLKLKTWGALAMEVSFLPLCLWGPTRALAWVALIVMHLGILSVVAFADLTMGMLMIHLFTFDPRWFRPKAAAGDPPVLFFDGVCGLCNASIDLLFRIDREGLFKVAPLQGATAKRVLGSDAGDESKMASVVLKDEAGLHRRSDAVLRVLSRLGGMWRLVEVFRLVPRGLRDALYELVARNRYRWFGKKETCRLPTPEERARFLD